jgi:hypothetical protein
MKVYVITDEQIEASVVIGVMSDKAKAKAWVRANRKNRAYDCLLIGEFEVDEISKTLS